MAEAEERQTTKRRKPLTGVVEAISGDKTIRVRINTLVKDPRYGKFLRKRTRLLVHDPNRQAAVGDRVEVVPCRPVSKAKSWRLGRVARSSDSPPEASAASEG